MLTPQVREYLEWKREQFKERELLSENSPYPTSQGVSVKDAEKNIERMIKDW